MGFAQNLVLGIGSRDNLERALSTLLDTLVSLRVTTLGAPAKSGPPRRGQPCPKSHPRAKLEPDIAPRDLIGGNTIFNLHRARVCLLLSMPFILAYSGITISAERLETEKSAALRNMHKTSGEGIVPHPFEHPNLHNGKRLPRTRLSDVGDALRICIAVCEAQFQACMAVAAIRTDEVPVCVGDRDSCISSCHHED